MEEEAAICFAKDNFKKIGYYVTTHFTQILGTQKVVVLALLAFLTPLSGLES